MLFEIKRAKQLTEIDTIYSNLKNIQKIIDHVDLMNKIKMKEKIELEKRLEKERSIKEMVHYTEFNQSRN